MTVFHLLPLRRLLGTNRFALFMFVTLLGLPSAAVAQIGGGPAFGELEPEERRLQQDAAREAELTGQRPASEKKVKTKAAQEAGAGEPTGATNDETKKAPDPAGGSLQDPSVAPDEAKPLEAGSSCEVDVFYEWSKKAEEHRRTAPNAQSIKADAPSVVFVTHAAESGTSLAGAKSSLLSRLPALHAQALDRCLEEHQNLTVCVSFKLRNLQDRYNRADFAVRRAMLEGIQADCASLQGSCLKGSSGKITCSEAPATTAAIKDAASPAKK